MKIQWHWGTGIVIALLLFISLILGFVYKMYYVDFHLVEKDYYPKELNYKFHMEKEANTKNLHEKIAFEQEEGNVIIQFPDTFTNKNISGEIHFYYIPNEKYDKKISITVDSLNRVLVPVKELWKGRYKIKIDYVVDGVKYYQEEAISFE